MRTQSKGQRVGVTADVVAARFGINGETVRRWARQGRIPGYRAGVAWRFDVGDVEEALRAVNARGTDGSGT